MFWPSSVDLVIFGGTKKKNRYHMTGYKGAYQLTTSKHTDCLCLSSAVFIEHERHNHIPKSFKIQLLL